MNALALLVATVMAAADAVALTNAELKNATVEWIDACAPSLTSEAGEVTCPTADRAECDAVEAKYNGSIGTWDVSAVTSMESLFEDAACFDTSLATWDAPLV